MGAGAQGDLTIHQHGDAAAGLPGGKELHEALEHRRLQNIDVPDFTPSIRIYRLEVQPLREVD